MTQSLLAGGMLDPTAGDPGFPEGPAGGLEGLTVSGHATGPLVTDSGESRVKTSGTFRNVTLECTTCEPVLQLGYSGDVYESRILGGGAGIRVDAAGGLGVTTNTRICGNDVVGSTAYDYGITAGTETRGPVFISRNTITSLDAETVGIHLANVNFLYTEEDWVDEIEISENIIQGLGVIGVSTLSPARIAKNTISLPTAAGPGIDVTMGPVWPVPVVSNAVLGNAVEVAGTALAVHDLAATFALLNNSFKGSSAFVIDGIPAAEVIAVNNLLHATGPNAWVVDTGEFGGVPSTLFNNDVVASACLVYYPETAVCVASAASLNACTWDWCTDAEDNISVPPQYGSSQILKLLPGSAGIDAGRSPAPWYSGSLLSTDLEGTPRPSGAAWDIGADEQ
jgi:hypothetical protein